MRDAWVRAQSTVHGGRTVRADTSVQVKWDSQSSQCLTLVVTGGEVHHQVRPYGSGTQPLTEKAAPRWLTGCCPPWPRPEMSPAAISWSFTAPNCSGAVPHWAAPIRVPPPDGRRTSFPLLRPDGRGGGRLQAVQAFVEGADKAGAVLGAAHGSLDRHGQPVFCLAQDDIVGLVVGAARRAPWRHPRCLCASGFALTAAFPPARRSGRLRRRVHTYDRRLPHSASGWSGRRHSSCRGGRGAVPESAWPLARYPGVASGWDCAVRWGGRGQGQGVSGRGSGFEATSVYSSSGTDHVAGLSGPASSVRIVWPCT